MAPDNNKRESPREPADGVNSDGKSTRNDKRNDDWIAEMERELQELAKKWPGSQK